MLPELKYFKLREWKCLAEIKDFLKLKHNKFFSIIDPSKIYSIEQIRICYSRALRITQQSDRIKRPESAFLMLLSGESQISRAQEETGISSSTAAVLAVYEDPEDLDAFVDFCGDSIIPLEKVPLPERTDEMDNLMFSKMAKVQLAL